MSKSDSDYESKAKSQFAPHTHADTQILWPTLVPAAAVESSCVCVCVCVGISFVFCHRKLHFALSMPWHEKFLLIVCTCVWSRRIWGEGSGRKREVRWLCRCAMTVMATFWSSSKMRCMSCTARGQRLEEMLSFYLIVCTCTNVFVPAHLENHTPLLLPLPCLSLACCCF